jgi:hypothetical protein
MTPYFSSGAAFSLGLGHGIVGRQDHFCLSRHIAVAPTLGVLTFHPLIGLCRAFFCLSAFVARESPSHFGLFIGLLPTDGRRLPANARSYNNAVQNVPNDEVTIRLGFGESLLRSACLSPRCVSAF